MSSDERTRYDYIHELENAERLAALEENIMRAECPENKFPLPVIQLWGTKDHVRDPDLVHQDGEVVVVTWDDGDQEKMSVYTADDMSHGEYLRLDGEVRKCPEGSMEEMTYEEFSNRVLQRHPEERHCPYCKRIITAAEDIDIDESFKTHLETCDFKDEDDEEDDDNG